MWDTLAYTSLKQFLNKLFNTKGQLLLLTKHFKLNTPFVYKKRVKLTKERAKIQLSMDFKTHCIIFLSHVSYQSFLLNVYALDSLQLSPCFNKLFLLVWFSVYSPTINAVNTINLHFRLYVKTEVH